MTIPDADLDALERRHPTPLSTHHNALSDRDRCDFCALISSLRTLRAERALLKQLHDAQVELRERAEADNTALREALGRLVLRVDEYRVDPCVGANIGCRSEDDLASALRNARPLLSGKVTRATPTSENVNSGSGAAIPSPAYEVSGGGQRGRAGFTAPEVTGATPIRCEECGGDGKEIEGDEAGVMVESGRPCLACVGSGKSPSTSEKETP